MSALLARRHEADYRLLVDVDESTWVVARADGAAFDSAMREHVSRAWPTLKLEIEAAAG